MVNHGQPNTVAGGIVCACFVLYLVKLGAYFALFVSLLFSVHHGSPDQTVSNRQIRATIIAAVSNLSTAYNLVNVNLTNATCWHSTGPGSALTTYVLVWEIEVS